MMKWVIAWMHCTGTNKLSVSNTKSSICFSKPGSWVWVKHVRTALLQHYRTYVRTCTPLTYDKARADADKVQGADAMSSCWFIPRIKELLVIVYILVERRSEFILPKEPNNANASEQEIAIFLKFGNTSSPLFSSVSEDWFFYLWNKFPIHK